MTGLADEIARLFSIPGRPEPGPVTLSDRAAAAHRDLLAAACTGADPGCDSTLHLIAALLPKDASTRKRFLCDPVLIEGLHESAPGSPTLLAWHDCTANPVSSFHARPPDHRAGRMLGNSALCLLLRSAPDWCGSLRGMIDQFGLWRCPLCDWSLSVTTMDSPASIAVQQPVRLRLDSQHATWSLATNPPRPFLQMPRQTLVQMITHNSPTVQSGGVRSLDAALRPRWQLATPLCSGGVRFLPIHCRTRSRAAMCGGFARHVHDELASASPTIHREFCGYTNSMLGFDRDGPGSVTVQSFSDPTQPGQICINVGMTAQNVPRACPFFITSLGHEMAHTKMYLAGSIGWRESWRLLNNAGERTGVIQRYGRSLAMRTLFQIPYTHVYEWTILMDACRARSDDELAATGDPIRFGEDLRDEIEEALAAIEALADLTPHGELALARFRRVFQDTAQRWRSRNWLFNRAEAELIQRR